MEKLIFIIVCCFFFYSCDTSEPDVNLEGTYQGTFIMTINLGTDSVFTSQGPITFEFSKTTYKCFGEKYLLPPGGAGKYKITSNQITLIDTAMHTAEFDHNLILNGDFTYQYNKPNLSLIQNDLVYHRYREIKLTYKD